MTVVLDTNVLVSACWKPGGLEAEVLRMALDSRMRVAVTEPVWAEYAEVLARRKLASVRAQSAEMLALLERVALRFDTPKEPLAAARDEEDNRFLECAAAARATFLITGNLKDYPANWPGTRIVNARQFLDAYNKELEVCNLVTTSDVPSFHAHTDAPDTGER